MPKRLTTEIFIERAKAKHDNKYDYSRVNYKNSITPVCIICPEHGEFWQRPDHHLNGSNCPKCIFKLRISWLKKDTSTFIKEAMFIHGDKYDYSKVNYIRNDKKVLIHCNKCGHDFWQCPRHHLSGQGCPKCAIRIRQVTRCKLGNSKISKLQYNLYMELLKKYSFDDVLCEYNSDERYPFACDFYIKSQDLFIELNGYYSHNDHWFNENSEDDIYQLNEWEKRNCSDEYGDYSGVIYNWTVRDVKKREYARKNNLNYVVFWKGKQNAFGLTDEIEKWFSDGCPIRQDWK